MSLTCVFSKMSIVVLVMVCAAPAHADFTALSDAGAPLPVEPVRGLDASVVADAGRSDAPGQSWPRAPEAGAPSAAPGAAPLPGSARVPVDEPVSVTVRTRSRADELRKSSLAVTVVDVERARRGSADLGEVLARSEGVSVQRAAGLGSTARFALAGFEGEQVRFFLDGVPLQLAGFPFGIENVPVNLIERVEIYRGVVPIRFGADALGGAVQLVTKRPREGSHGAVSYQAGSFDTHRFTLQSSHLDTPTGLYAQVTGYLDRSRNDYVVNVPTNNMGMVGRADMRRFHDGYAAEGAVLELGALDRKWAERLSLRTFFSRQARDLQSDLAMVKPYGDATAGVLSTGSTLTYKQTIRDASLELTGNYAYTEAHIRDVSRCLYDWFGRCATLNARPGEIRDLTAREPYLYSHGVLVRANLTVPFLRRHAVSVSLSPTTVARSGEDRSPEFPSTRDPLDVNQQLHTVTSAVAYQLHALDERLEAEAFVKEYAQFVRGERSVPRDLEQRDFNRQRLGAGSTARYRLTEWLLTKASYEWATRLPTADELFGDGIGVEPNVELRPEVSHNLNLELALDAQGTKTGSYLLSLVGFYRGAHELINRQAAGTFSGYRNIADARVRGSQARARWIARKDLLTVDGNVTYQDVRNESEVGEFAAFRGDRIPNRPYLFGTVLARVELSELIAPRDQLWLTFTTRCTGEFDRGWGSVGLNRFVVPRQVLHNIALTYLARSVGRRNLSNTIEVQNLTNARAYDFFGAQRPGRAVFFKLVAEL